MSAPAPPGSLTRLQYEQDFDALWGEVRDYYAYFDQKATDWDRVRSLHRPRVEGVSSTAEFIALLEGVLEELYDFHAHLNTNTASSPRLVPSDADIWARWSGESVIITQVRPTSAADRAGLRPGMQITSINGVPIADATRTRIGRSLRRHDRGARDWALLASVAGKWNEPRVLGVVDASGSRRIAIDDQGSRAGSARTRLLESRRLERNFGYIRIHNSLGDLALVGQFDAALAALRSTRGLILDLRDTPSGGNTTVARGILGRFATREMPYQRHLLPAEERQHGVRRSWIELVSPRGSFAYTAPIVALVDHWTGSMGEGIAIGLDGMGAATVVGTEMARLSGATSGITLPNTGIGVTFPTEKLFHVNGAPREQFVPTVPVDLSIALGGSTDPILEAGLGALNARAGPEAKRP